MCCEAPRNVGLAVKRLLRSIDGGDADAMVMHAQVVRLGLGDMRVDEV